MIRRPKTTDQGGGIHPFCFHREGNTHETDQPSNGRKHGAEVWVAKYLLGFIVATQLFSEASRDCG